MPYKKKNKQQLKTCTRQNNLIKKRLMQISISVDNYIYKHKPISIEEAKMYAQEISLYKTQCTRDVHILQVIDKLTRCMKSIVEETRNRTTNLNATSSEKAKNIDIFSESPLNVNVEVTKTSKKDSDSYEVQPSKNAVSENIKPSQVVFVDSESENITNLDEVTLNEENLNNYINNLSIECQSNKVGLENIKQTSDKNINMLDPIMPTNNVFDSEKNNIESTDKRPLKAFETPISNFKELPNKIQVKLDQAKPNVSVAVQPIHDKNYLTHKCLQTTKCDSKVTITLEKNRQIRTTTFCHFDTKHKKQKSNIKVTERTHNSVNGAKKEKNNSEQVNPDPKKNTAKKSSSKEKNKNESKKPKVISKKNTINSKIPNKFKHTNVHIKSDEVSITACNLNRYTKPKTKNIIPHITSYTCKSFENDLSWVGNIKYVREVSACEFDPKLNGLEDTFWDDFSLPGGWSDTEFLY